ncbi:MAG: choice-of-anchor J domain-containing protein, partial [Muribaculaceae bacterium]|nr:choice-of-anchor J domain-containing protein [Muribaculaceae bacterium]
VKVCDFADGEQVCGLYIDTPPAAAGAPAAPVDVTAAVPGGALSGSVSFTVPATLFDGTPATGTVSYAVLHGTTVMASGTAAHGATVTAPFAVASGGNYEFAGRLSNAVGDSPDTKVSVFVGTGTPAKPQVTARYENGQMHVEWTAVTESQDGGYIDPTAVTYKVVRYPSRFVSAAATTATSLDEQVDEPDNLSEFYYTVEASYAGGNSGEARSNTVVLGALRAPYSNSLGTPESLDYWTVLDVNDDGKTFGFQSTENAVGIGYNREKPMDDWLITPPIKLEAGKSYRFTFEARTMSTDEETFEVKLGSQPLASAMTVDVIPATEFLSVAYRQFEGYLVAPATGKYYLGIHACSPAYTYRLYVRNLNIESPQSAAGPGAPTELRAIPDPNGAFRATIKLKAPTVDFDGNELSELTAVEI